MRLGSAALLLGLIALVAFITMTMQTLRIAPKIAKVTEVRGSVVAQLPARLGRSVRTVSLKLGSVVASGTIIQTGPDGSATLHWVDELTLRIGPNSKLKVNRSRFDRTRKTLQAIFHLDIGSVFLSLQKKSSEETLVDLTTPGVTAAVRGTALTVQVDETGQTLVTVSEGVVSVFPRSGSGIRLKAHDTALFSPDGHLVSKSVVQPSGRR